MKKLFLLVLLALITATASMGQVKNIGAGGQFLTTSRIRLLNDGLAYANIYTPLYGGSLFYEVMDHGLTHMWEASYIMGKIESVSTGEGLALPEWSNVNWKDNFDPIKTFSLFYYLGNTFLSGQRLQIPVYIGIGGNYNIADPIKGMVWCLAAKARVKFYITDHVGLFAGGGWKGGIGTQTFNKTKYETRQRVLNVEAGLTFSL